MGAGLIAPGHKGGFILGANLFEGLYCRLHAFDFQGVVRGADDDEIIIHHVMAIDEGSLFHGLQFLLFGVHYDNVGVAPLADFEGRAGAHGHHVHLDAGLFLKDGQQVIEQSRILGAGGGGALDPGFRPHAPRR